MRLGWTQVQKEKYKDLSRQLYRAHVDNNVEEYLRLQTELKTLMDQIPLRIA